MIRTFGIQPQQSGLSLGSLSTPTRVGIWLVVMCLSIGGEGLSSSWLGILSAESFKSASRSQRVTEGSDS